MNRFVRTIASLAVMVGLGSVVTMCGSSPGSFCDAKCDCRGCSDRDFDECTYDYEDDEVKADRRGCLDLFYEWADCVESDGCRGSDYDYYCKPERDRWRRCID